MAKSFYTQGTGSQQTLNDSQDEKIPVYATKAQAQADLANLAEGQIIATKDGTADTQTLKDYVNFRYIDNESQNADANTLTAPGVYSVNATDPTNQHLGIIETNGWCVIYVTRVDSNPNYVQQIIADWNGNNWIRVMRGGNWDTWIKIPHMDELYNVTIPNYWTDDASAPIDVLSIIDNLNASYGLQRTSERHAVIRIGGATTRSPVGNGNTDFIYHIDTLPDKLWMHVTAYDIRTNNIFSIEKNLGTWGQWSNINISLDSSTPVPAGTSFTNVIAALTWHLGQMNWNDLISYTYLTRSGKIELQGYYWGSYTASHMSGGYIEISGVISYGGQPCNFAAFRDMATGTWKVSVNGEYLLYDTGGWIATYSGGDVIGVTPIIKIRGGGTLLSYISMTEAISKTGYTLQGSITFTPNVNTNWVANNKYNNNSRQETQPAGAGWGFESFSITAPDSATQSWISTADNKLDSVYANLWGNDWSQCYISAYGEFIG